MEIMIHERHSNSVQTGEVRFDVPSSRCGTFVNSIVEKLRAKAHHHFRQSIVCLLGLAACFLLMGQSFATVFVDEDASPGGDGNSWTTAYETIQAGIDDADVLDEEVWVAEGTYLESITMRDGVAVYGGFDGTETLLSQRDIEANVTIIDASIADGGGPADHVVVMNNVSGARIDGFTVTGGTADAADLGGKGGGILCVNADETNAIANCTITGNSTDANYGQGGGLYLEDSAPTISHCTITQNEAERLGSGGGLYCYHSSPTIENCTIVNNEASAHGGGLGCEDSTVALISCTISDNVASDFGGGVFPRDSDLTITHSLVIGNSAWEGGGVMSWRSVPTIVNSLLCGNHAGRWGGAVCAYDSSPLTMTNCVVAGNSAGWNGGGGLELHEWTTSTITNCIISGNWTEGNGGGVYLFTDSGYLTKIVNSTICSNAAEGYGGGVYCTPRMDFMSATITNTVFDDNLGQAVYESGPNSDVTLRNCLFHSNIGGDVCNEGLATLTGADEVNTIPEASDNVDGNPSFVTGLTGRWTDWPVYDLATNRTTLTDSTASFIEGALVGSLINPNTANRAQAFITANTTTTIEAVGDLIAYVSNGDAYRMIDHHIQYGSPCIDAGTPDGAPSTDIDGDPRPIDVPGIGADGTGTEYDIGADEFAELDTDGDGLSDDDEEALGTDPADPDTDADGLSDGEEVHSYLTDPNNADTDDDGVDDGEEVNTYFTDPLDDDSDDDGYTDGREVARGSDPNDPDSVPTFPRGGAGEPCFIATVAYGTPAANEVAALRDFRDRYLLTNRAGTAFVKAYYSVSPPLARFLAMREPARAVARFGLAPIVAFARLAVDYPLAAVTTTAMMLAIAGVWTWLLARKAKPTPTRR